MRDLGPLLSTCAAQPGWRILYAVPTVGPLSDDVAGFFEEPIAAWASFVYEGVQSKPIMGLPMILDGDGHSTLEIVDLEDDQVVRILRPGEHVQDFMDEVKRVQEAPNAKELARIKPA